MLTSWNPPRPPEGEELARRLTAARERLGALQLKIKEHSLPVLVLVEGWGAAGKGSMIGRVIRQIDPRFFSVNSMSAPTEEEQRFPFLHRYMAAIPEAGKFAFLDSGWMDEVVKARLRDHLEGEKYEKRIASVNRFERTLTDNGYLVMKLLYWDRFAAGMAPLLIGVCFLGSVQIFFIGLVGEYILSINQRVMHRPLVIEEERINFDTQNEGKTERTEK